MDFRNEASNTRKMRARVDAATCVIPRTYPALSDASVLVLERLEGRTVAALEKTDPVKARAALATLVDVLGKMIFVDGWFHADTHPGNVMLLDDGRVGLIDFGQCCGVDDRARKLLCMTMMLLRCRSPVLLKLVFCDLPSTSTDFEFDFNTRDVRELGALFQYFFDTDITGDGSVDAATFEALKATARYKPTALATATAAPPWIVFFGRVVASLRKCFEKCGVGRFSTVDAWYPVARAALAAQRARETEPDDAADWLLTMLPEDPALVDAGRDALNKVLATPGPERAAGAARLRALVAGLPLAAALDALVAYRKRPAVCRAFAGAAALWCAYGLLLVALLPLRLAS